MSYDDTSGTSQHASFVSSSGFSSSCLFFLLYLEVDVDTYGIPSLHHHEALHIVVCESRPHYGGGGIHRSVHIHLEMYTITFTVQHCAGLSETTTVETTIFIYCVHSKGTFL